MTALRTLWKCLKFIVIVVLAVEAFSFLAMTFHNYVVYGHAFSHVPVRYDPDALFLMLDRNPPPAFNSICNNPQLNRTIWMFGGSTVRGNAHLDENKTLPAFLSKFLNERAKPYHFTVLNLGENGFNCVLESKYLEKALIENSPPPDIVIFYDGANDAFQYAEYRQPVGHIGYRRLKAFIESYHRSWFGLLKPINAAVHASYTNEFIDRIRMLCDTVEPDSQTLRQMVELTTRRYDHVSRVVSCYGAKFVLIWQPMLWVENCKAPENVRQAEKTTFVDADKFPLLRQSVRNTYAALEEALRSKSYFVNFRNTLCSRTTPLFWPDGIHLRHNGNELVAGRMAELLIQRFPDKFPEESVSGTKGR